MFETQIANGMAWLDKYRPGWEETIPPGEIDMGRSCRCVLGWSFGDFWKVVAEHPNDRNLMSWDMACALGFVVSWDMSGDKWDTLTEEWELAIAQRRRK